MNRHTNKPNRLFVPIGARRKSLSQWADNSGHNICTRAGFSILLFLSSSADSEPPTTAYTLAGTQFGLGLNRGAPEVVVVSARAIVRARARARASPIASSQPHSESQWWWWCRRRRRQRRRRRAPMRANEEAREKLLLLFGSGVGTAIQLT